MPSMPCYASLCFIMPCHQLPSCCFIYYPCTGAIETMGVDQRVILHHLGFKNVDQQIKNLYAKRRPSEKRNSTANIYRESWRSIEPEIITKIQRIYSTDFRMFGYPSQPWISRMDLLKLYNECMGQCNISVLNIICLEEFGVSLWLVGLFQIWCYCLQC